MSNWSFHPIHHSEMGHPAAAARWEAYRLQIGRPVSSEELLDFANGTFEHNGMYEFDDVRARAITARRRAFARKILAERMSHT